MHQVLNRFPKVWPLQGSSDFCNYLVTTRVGAHGVARYHVAVLCTLVGRQQWKVRDTLWQQWEICVMSRTTHRVKTFN